MCAKLWLEFVKSVVCAVIAEIAVASLRKTHAKALLGVGLDKADPVEIHLRNKCDVVIFGHRVGACEVKFVLDLFDIEPVLSVSLLWHKGRKLFAAAGNFACACGCENRAALVTYKKFDLVHLQGR